MVLQGEELGSGRYRPSQAGGRWTERNLARNCDGTQVFLLFLVCFDSWAHAVVAAVASTWLINQISFDKLHIKDAYCVMFLLKIKFLCTNTQTNTCGTGTEAEAEAAGLESARSICCNLCIWISLFLNKCNIEFSDKCKLMHYFASFKFVNSNL